MLGFNWPNVRRKFHLSAFPLLSPITTAISSEASAAAAAIICRARASNRNVGISMASFPRGDLDTVLGYRNEKVIRGSLLTQPSAVPLRHAELRLTELLHPAVFVKSDRRGFDID